MLNHFYRKASKRSLIQLKAKQREQYRFYLQGKQSAMDGSRYKMLSDLGFNWSIKGRKYTHENNESSPSIPEEYHRSDIHDSPVMITKSPHHILMDNYNESHQGISQREMGTLQTNDTLKGDINPTAEVDIQSNNT